MTEEEIFSKEVERIEKRLNKKINPDKWSIYRRPIYIQDKYILIPKKIKNKHDTVFDYPIKHNILIHGSPEITTNKIEDQRYISEKSIPIFLDSCEIYGNCKIKGDVIIKDNVKIHGNCIISNEMLSNNCRIIIKENIEIFGDVVITYEKLKYYISKNYDHQLNYHTKLGHTIWSIVIKGNYKIYNEKTLENYFLTESIGAGI